MNALSSISFATVALLVASPETPASFHFMQIEQVIGGVDGDATAQAIQLRMRFQFQCFLGNGARLQAHDAAGLNPVVIALLDRDLPGCDTGDRVVVATARFLDLTDPPLHADFLMVAPIPESYLAAGSLTFENALGTEVYWRLSWGGIGYTGDTSGTVVNDADGEFGPPWPGPLPSAGTQALLFQNTAGAQSTANIDDYLLTPGAAVFTNNDCDRFRLGDPCPWDCATVVCQDVDNDVDLLDFLILVSLWDTAGPACDFDGGGVGITDFLALLAHWGPCE
ncbi:MAG: hypothetical protein IID28_09855 [Planctomycetes bacterium]|nr:hypothetical protein [Planctomycetota bacterium]